MRPSWRKELGIFHHLTGAGAKDARSRETILMKGLNESPVMCVSN